MTISRRSMLQITAQSALGLVAATTVGPILLSSCKKNESNGQLAKSETIEVTPCPDQESLTDQEKAIRSSLKYEDSSSVPNRTCDNCKLYTLPRGTMCGGCKVVPGPIHPKGYCTAWLHRM